MVSEASTTLGLSSFVCDDSFPLESSGSGIITDIGIGTIMIEGDNGMIYQLSISQCTKLASTSPNSSIRLGNRVYFKGAELFALSSSVLYNAYLIVSVVGSAWGSTLRSIWFLHIIYCKLENTLTHDEFMYI